MGETEHYKVDLAARRTAAKLITDFASGLITTNEYERAFPERSKDPALFAIFRRLWGFYDDLHEHRLEGKWALDQDARALWGRCILFVMTDLEFRWPEGRPLVRRAIDWILGARRTREGDHGVWPFHDRSEYADALRTLGHGHLPLSPR